MPISTGTTSLGFSFMRVEWDLEEFDLSPGETTSCYITEMLDDGPIIEQDVLRITHRHALLDLIQTGRDLEHVVLSRAARSHLERYLDPNVISPALP